MPSTTPKHLLIAGHGYLGQAVSRDFLAAGWKVSAVSKSERPSSPPLPEADRQLLEYMADLSSPQSIAALATRIETPDFILHCASSGRGGAEVYRAVYLDGCHNLLEAFPSVPLLYTSSTSVYGQTDGSLVTERSPAEPDRETGEILRATEELLLSKGGIAFRLSGIYGPARSAILKKFLSGSATIEEDGRRFLNQIHRDDAAGAILHAATSGIESGIYNVSDSHPRSQLETYTGLAGIFERPLPPSAPRDLNRKRGWTHKRVSNAKLAATGWTPRFPDFLRVAADIAPTIEA